jgi:hypothetical protein
MKSKNIFKLYDAIYEERFAHLFPKPTLAIFNEAADDDDPYYGAFEPEEFEIEFIRPMHTNWLEVLDTLVHELTHVDQIMVKGRVNPATYHDEWFKRNFKKHMVALCEEWR